MDVYILYWIPINIVSGPMFIRSFLYKKLILAPNKGCRWIKQCLSSGFKKKIEVNILIWSQVMDVCILYWIPIYSVSGSMFIRSFLYEKLILAPNKGCRWIKQCLSSGFKKIEVNILIWSQVIDICILLVF